MKNQIDLIVSLSALIIGLSIAGYFYSTARKPGNPPPVPAANLAPVKLPGVGIEMMNGIYAGPQHGGGGGGARGGRAR